MDSAMGDALRKQELCFIPIPSPWIQKHKVAPLMRKAHWDGSGMTSRSGESGLFSQGMLLECLRTFWVILTLLKRFPAPSNAEHGVRLQAQT